MDAVELRIACAKMGKNYSDIARALRIGKSTVWQWAHGRAPIPYMAEVLINQMVANKEGREMNALAKTCAD